MGGGQCGEEEGTWWSQNLLSTNNELLHHVIEEVCFLAQFGLEGLRVNFVKGGEVEALHT